MLQRSSVQFPNSSDVYMPSESLIELPTAYVDTTVFKFSATELIRYVGQEKRVKWEPIEDAGLVFTERVINPNDNIKNIDLKLEAEVLPHLAEQGRTGRVRYVISDESQYEIWGLPALDSETGTFYGDPLEFIESPFKGDRVMGGLGIDGKAAQMDFLCSIKDKRFLAFQKAAGAYQGAHLPNRNQMIDAFHLWCAEHNNCDYFLTLDFSLIRALNRSKLKTDVRIVRPTDLYRLLSNPHGV